MNYIVYQAYNSIDNLNECLYSIYSVEKFSENIKIVIYTDQESYFKDRVPSKMNIDYRHVSQEEITKWRGINNFVHRFKIEVLLDLIRHLKEDANILYIDTDTTIKKSLDPVFKEIEGSRLFMHVNEGEIGDTKNNLIFKKVTNYAKSNQKYSDLVPINQDMWNAGAIGFKSTDIDLLNQVLDHTDKIYSEFPKHIAEQLSFSIIFTKEKARNLKDLESEIFHYWNFKEFRSVLHSFFRLNESEEEIRKELHKIDPEKLIQPKLDYPKLPFLKKQYRKLTKKWELANYEKRSGE